MTSPRAASRAAIALVFAGCCSCLAACEGNSGGTVTSIAQKSSIGAPSARLPQDASSVDPTARRAAARLTAASTPGDQGYRIGPQDMLELSVFKAPELQRTAHVSETGTISLPLIGEMQAAGCTAQELEREIAARLGSAYLQKPQVSVTVREYNSQRVTIDGAVRRPGVYPLRGRTTLVEVIAHAQGFADLSDTTVIVFRQSHGKKAAARFDVAAIRAGTAQDPEVLPGDTIIAPTSAMKETFAVIIKAIPLATVFALL